MRFMKFATLLISAVVLFVSGCGGGGGGGGTASSTKSATIVLSYQKANITDEIGGLDISITLPAGASIKVDGSGAPLASSVFLSGAFAGIVLNPAGISYSDASATQKKLVVIAGNFTNLTSQQGGFMTVVCDVPVAYTPVVNDLVIEPVNPPDIFTAQSGGGGIPVTVSATFN
jgi:hypothetical protein